MITTVMNIISNIMLFVFAEKIYPYYYPPKKKNGISEDSFNYWDIGSACTSPTNRA